MLNKSSGNPIAVPLIAVLLLSALSFVDWHNLTDGRLTNFNLVEDIVEFPFFDHADNRIIDNIIDPVLEEAIAEFTSETELPVHTIENGDLSQKPVNHDISSITDSDTIIKVDRKVEAIDGVQPIEDFTPSRSGLVNLKKGLASRDSRRARIAVIGDSYIEGDIFTQDVRRLLQQEYGGRGVGYMSMHSDFPGFRRSVGQSDNGWTVRDMRHRPSDPLKPLSGEYCHGNSGSAATFKGSKIDNASSWSSSKLLYVAAAEGAITVKLDSITSDFSVEPSSEVCMLALDGETSRVTFTSRADNLSVIGAWLEDDCGVGVDCMSLRGNSGASHKSISFDVAKQINRFIPYDLIVVEYGMNALSAEQADYSSYARVMSKVVARLKECFPNADILLMGVGDRGQKSGASISSVPTVDAMVDAQRQCAFDCGVLFWDTRAAMGGTDAIVEWRRRGLVNADYIHLNHKGGEILAEQFVNSLKMMLHGND